MLLLPGANGQLGHSLLQLAERYPHLALHGRSSGELDICDRDAVDRFFAQNPVRWCINCAAYTAVDKAESEPDRARAVNVTGAANLARACARHGAGLVHISTDYVYHTRQNTPFVEIDAVRPRGVYARTKLAGERAVQKALPGAMIVRTSWVYAPHGHNFVRTMLRLGAERPAVRVVADQIGTPTYAPDLAAALLSIIDRVEKNEIDRAAVAGIWHYSNEGVASWYDFAHAIFALAGLPCRAEPIATRDYPTPAARPPFSVLNKEKIKAAFGLEIPHWRDSLYGMVKGER